MNEPRDNVNKDFHQHIVYLKCYTAWWFDPVAGARTRPLLQRD